MARPLLIAYFDTSALIKLYVPEPGSERARADAAFPAHAAAALIAYAECRAAFAAMHRNRRLNADELDHARRALEMDWPDFMAVSLTIEIVRQAGAFADLYGLRGYDAVQLACFAHLWSEVKPEPVSFCCFDTALTAAADHWLERNQR